MFLKIVSNFKFHSPPDCFRTYKALSNPNTRFGNSLLVNFCGCVINITSSNSLWIYADDKSIWLSIIRTQQLFRVSCECFNVWLLEKMFLYNWLRKPVSNLLPQVCPWNALCYWPYPILEQIHICLAQLFYSAVFLPAAKSYFPIVILTLITTIDLPYDPYHSALGRPN